MKNVWLLILANMLWSSWFWLGIWVLYYLRFTTYVGIGLIEMCMILLVAIGEIPSGAIADLFGHKKTVALAFLGVAVGNLIVGLAVNAWFIFVGVLVITIANVFYSGAFEALFYSAVELVPNTKFETWFSRSTSLSLLAAALASIVGGYLYFLHPAAPFLLFSLATLLGFCLVSFVKIKSTAVGKTLSPTYVNQLKVGGQMLLSPSFNRSLLLALLAVGAVFVLTYQVFDDLLLVVSGFSAVELGWILAIVYLLSAGSTFIFGQLSKRPVSENLIWPIGLLVSFSMILATIASKFIAGAVVTTHFVVKPLYDVTSVSYIAKRVSQGERATTISTFRAVSSIPYVLLAVPLGAVMTMWSVQGLAGVLGVVLLICLAVLWIGYQKKNQAEHA